jgi:hypothetical protein
MPVWSIRDRIAATGDRVYAIYPAPYIHKHKENPSPNRVYGPSPRRSSRRPGDRRLGLGAALDRRLRFSTPSLCLRGLTLSSGPRPQLRLIHRIGVRPRTSSQIPRRVLFLRLRAGVVQW